MVIYHSNWKQKQTWDIQCTDYKLVCHSVFGFLRIERLTSINWYWRDNLFCKENRRHSKNKILSFAGYENQREVLAYSYFKLQYTFTYIWICNHAVLNTVALQYILLYSRISFNSFFFKKFSATVYLCFQVNLEIFISS